MTTIQQQLTRRLLIAFGIPLLICGITAYVLIRNEVVEQFEERDAPRVAGQRSGAAAEQTAVQNDGENHQDELDSRITTIALLLAGCGGALLAVTFVVVPGIVRRAFAPVDELAVKAAGVTAASLSTRFDSSGLPAELAPVAIRLNELLGRLEESFARERQFTADVSHELRTPIAELKNLAEVARKWPDARSAEHDADVEAIARQMDGIVSRLLALVRSDEGRLTVDLATVDLVEILNHTWRPLQAAAAARGLDVRLSLPASAPATADSVLLQSIVANLLQNAIAYAPAGDRVDVALGQHEGRQSISVSNSAGSLTPADVSRFFDRFWRHDSSRTGGHAGLGLSLARTFAHAMGGDVRASLDGGRITVALTLA